MAVFVFGPFREFERFVKIALAAFEITREAPRAARGPKNESGPAPIALAPEFIQEYFEFREGSSVGAGGAIHEGIFQRQPVTKFSRA